MFLLAPLAGLLIFLLMLVFFKKVTLVLVAMILAMVSVIWTMGLLIGSGLSLHIMSSMIPIFLIPIAILDSVHILSELFDRYRNYRTKEETLRAVYSELFAPITFTSLTTAVAFASLTLAPIPPVQVFGIFVAAGVVIAWLLTLLLIPAYVALMSEERLRSAMQGDAEAGSRLLSGGLRKLGLFTVKRAYFIFPALVVAAIAAGPGLGKITVNDNPVRWFKSGNEVREATDVFNTRFAGAFNASFVVEADRPGALTEPAAARAVLGLQDLWRGVDFVGTSVSYVDAVVSEAGNGGGATGVPDTADDIEAFLDTAALSRTGGLVRHPHQRGPYEGQRSAPDEGRR